jgi:hypothetical protein
LSATDGGGRDDTAQQNEQLNKLCKSVFLADAFSVGTPSNQATNEKGHVSGTICKLFGSTVAQRALLVGLLTALDRFFPYPAVALPAFFPVSETVGASSLLR